MGVLLFLSLIVMDHPRGYGFFELFWSEMGVDLK